MMYRNREREREKIKLLHLCILLKKKLNLMFALDQNRGTFKKHSISNRSKGIN